MASKQLLLSVTTFMACCSLRAEPPSTFSFTNKQGVAVMSAEVVRVRSEDVIFRLPGDYTGLRTVKLSDLPAELAKKFNYDPEAIKRQRIQKEQAAAKDAPLRAAQERANMEQQRVQAIRASAFAGRVYIEGKIVQKVEEGLLVHSGTEIRGRTEAFIKSRGLPSETGGTSTYRGYKDGVVIYDDFCLLTDYSAGRSLVDNDQVGVMAYPNGEFSYTATSGGKRTVRRFTADITKVTVPLDPAAETASKAFRP